MREKGISPIIDPRSVGLIAAVFFTTAVLGALATASETCVEDARAALDEWSPKAFGPQATVQGPKRLETIEREELAEIAKCRDCPQKPFGYQYAEWEQFKRLIRDSDCVVFFRSNPASWKGLYGMEGYALIENRKVVRIIVTMMS